MVLVLSLSFRFLLQYYGILRMWLLNPTVVGLITVARVARTPTRLKIGCWLGLGCRHGEALFRFLDHWCRITFFNWTNSPIEGRFFSDLSFLDPLVTAISEDVDIIEIQVQRHEAEGKNVSIHIFRHIGLASHSKTRRIIQYGLPRNGANGTISLTSDDLAKIHSSIRM